MAGLAGSRTRLRWERPAAVSHPARAGQSNAYNRAKVASALATSLPC